MRSHLPLRRAKPPGDHRGSQPSGRWGCLALSKLQRGEKGEGQARPLNPPGRQEPPSSGASLGGAALSCPCCTRPSGGLCLCACDKKSHSYIAARLYKTQQGSPLQIRYVFFSGLKGKEEEYLILIGELYCIASVGRRGQGSMGVQPTIQICN